jgi:D-alanyl-D-alanine carboxypeptidase/D-alanyl-D-alanine-endopeptidase (penicillin-binding protein 4)
MALFGTRFYPDDNRCCMCAVVGISISEELAPPATELVAAIGKEQVTGIVLDASWYP